VVGNVSGLVEHWRAIDVQGVKATVRQTNAFDRT